MLATDSQQIVSLIMKLSDKIEKSYVKKAIDKNLGDLTLGEARTIIAIDTEGYKTMKQVAKAIAVAPNAAPAVVDRLVNKGLVERKPGEEDRRLCLVKLTDKGASMHHKIDSTLKDETKDFFHYLDEQETNSLLMTLEKIHENI